MVVIAQVEFPTLLFLSALAVTILILLVRVQRYYGRPRAPQPSWPSPRREKPGEQGRRSAEPAPMVNWEVEMHETARKLCAQLDSKMGALEQLIREADRAAARLEAALAAGRGGESPSRWGPAPADAPPAPPEGPSESPPVSQAEGLRSAGPADVPAAHPPTERRYEEIYTLADYGLAPSEIAHRVGSPVGEVELILSLRGKR
jgi:hypothetical protein